MSSRIQPELEATAGQWRYISCDCYVRLPSAIRVVITQECEACGNTNLVFIHTLEHEQTEKQIQVGIECARILAGDWEVPQLAENETKRKERWRRERYGTPGRCVTTVQNLIDKGKI